MADEAVLYSILNGVATLTLNRPDNKNALSVDLVDALGDGISQAIEDATVRVIELTNNGNTFCAGANLKGDGGKHARYTLVDLFTLMQESPKPIVGRIQGHCMGGGVGLAAACDLSVAANDVMIGFTEVRIGVAPAIISVVCLPKMNRADAMELFLSGEKISAGRAAEVGLLNYSVERSELNVKVGELLMKLSRGGPLALAAAKQLVLKVQDMPQSDAFSWTAEISGNLFRSDEASEGIAAFRERRDAHWIPEKP